MFHKAIVIGDVHAQPGNLDKVDKLFDLVAELVASTGIRDVLLLGDLLHTKEIVRGSCLNKYFYRFSAMPDLTFHCIVGNHDWFNLDCKDHSLQTLDVLPNVIIYDTPRASGDVVIFPYQPLEVIKKSLKEYPQKHVFGHFDIQSFDYGNGHISTEGLEVSDFKKRKVISGHYHKYQKQDNITYLGTPFSHSFGETNQEKFIGLWSIEEGLYKLIPTELPEHKTYEAKSKEMIKEILSSLDEGDHNRIVFEGTREELTNLEIPDTVKFVVKEVLEPQMDAIDETMSPEEQFKQWCVEHKKGSRMEKFGLKVLKNV